MGNKYKNNAKHIFDPYILALISIWSTSFHNFHFGP